MGLFRLVTRVGRLRRGAIRVLEEWSPRCREALDRTRLTGRLVFYLFRVAEQTPRL